MGGTGTTTTPATASTTGFGTTAETTPATTDSTGTSTGTTTTTVSFAMSFDGSRDLTLFNYGTQATPANGVLLSAHAAAYDLASAGAISGTLALSATLSAAAATTNASDRLNIEATAQIASADGTHHVVVARAPVQTDGTFTLYPLPSNSSTPTNYDVVIHGAGIATMIVKTIPVTVTPPTSSSTVSTAVVATTTATTPVSIGTLNPRAATPFYVNLTPVAGAPLPGGAAVVFYQTLPAANELPYVIEEAAVDPINLNLALAQPLSAAATIDSGTYTASGTTLTLTSSTPAEGGGNVSRGRGRSALRRWSGLFQYHRGCNYGRGNPDDPGDGRRSNIERRIGRHGRLDHRLGHAGLRREVRQGRNHRHA